MSFRTRLARAVDACVPMLVLAGLVAVLAAWVDDKRLVLDYLRVLAWPVVVASVLWWLRHQLKAKLNDLLELSAGPAKARFAEAAANREFTSDLEEPARVLVSPQDDEGASEPQGEADPEAVAPAPSGLAVGRPDLATASAAPDDDTDGHDPGNRAQKNQMAAAREKVRRQAMEQVIRESAAWGYDMAELGYKTRPVPEIEWDEEGRPRILRARGERPDEVAQRARLRAVLNAGRPPGVAEYEVEPSRFEQIRRLEREIQKLEDQQSNPFVGGMATRLAGGDGGLSRLKKKLGQLDPNSPWA